MSFPIELNVMDKHAGETPRGVQSIMAFIDDDGSWPGVRMDGSEFNDSTTYRYWIALSAIREEVAIAKNSTNFKPRSLKDLYQEASLSGSGDEIEP